MYHVDMAIATRCSVHSQHLLRCLAVSHEDIRCSSTQRSVPLGIVAEVGFEIIFLSSEFALSFYNVISKLK